MDEAKAINIQFSLTHLHTKLKVAYTYFMDDPKNSLLILKRPLDSYSFSFLS